MPSAHHQTGYSVTAVIFDLDGTLIDSAPAICEVVNGLFGELSVPALTLQESKGYMGYGAPRFLDQALASRGLGRSQAEFAGHLHRFLELYEAAPPDANPPFAGVERALATLLSRGVRLGLCTNKPTAPTVAILKALHWDGIFKAVVTGDSLPQRKPSPEPLFETARRLASRDCLFVGDSEVDAAAAHAAKMPFFLHEAGYRNATIAELNPRSSFTCFDALPDLVAKYAKAA
jgi:phosphoglycolate phosphatase